MIAAFISDQNYPTLPGIAVEFFDLATGKSTCFMSPASGVLLRADLGHGSYRVDLARDGTPRKRIESSLFSNQNKSRIPRNMIELISERSENTRRTVMTLRTHCRQFKSSGFAVARQEVGFCTGPTRGRIEHRIH